MSFIEYRKIEKTYTGQGFPAVKDINLSIEKGEILALVGESGSGKTTLLRLAAGLEEPTSGGIYFKGECIAGDNTWIPPEKRKFGMMSQEGALFPHLTIEGNIAYGLKGTAPREQTKIIGEVLELVGMEGFGKRFPHELSGGERQRIALARALAPQPEVIFLDEPFSNLDTTLRCELRDEICVILKSLGTTAILVVHDPDDALNAGERIAIMRLGELHQVATAVETYHRPACDYCANLFGPANEVIHEEKKIWLRPEQFSIAEGGSHQAVVDRVRETGRFSEIHVKPCHTKTESWVLHEPAGSKIKPGDEIRVAYTLPAYG